MRSHDITYSITTEDGRTLELSGEYVVEPRSKAIGFSAIFAEDSDTGEVLEAYAEENEEAIIDILEQAIAKLTSPILSEEIQHEL